MTKRKTCVANCVEPFAHPVGPRHRLLTMPIERLKRFTLNRLHFLSGLPRFEFVQRVLGSEPVVFPTHLEY